MEHKIGDARVQMNYVLNSKKKNNNDLELLKGIPQEKKITFGNGLIVARLG